VLRILWIGLAAGSITLGALWVADRSHRWDRPRLDPATFEVLRGRPAAGPGSRDIVLVPLNPGCPRCLRSWHRLLAACSPGPRCERYVALLVDVPRPPDLAALERLAAPRLWWDRNGVWRKRWGHRIYGERIRFDAAGRYRGTSPPP
jgi:hypothetical protein